jgi:hypothetical protein
VSRRETRGRPTIQGGEGHIERRASPAGKLLTFPPQRRLERPAKARPACRVIPFPPTLRPDGGPHASLPPFHPRAPASPAAARLLRATLSHLGPLLETDPWLPVPQSSCSFRFGDRKAPLPLAALAILWEKWPAARGTCPACGAEVYGFAFGGLLSVGGVAGLCAGCGLRLQRPVGGLCAVGEQVRPLLRNTPFRLTVGVFGGSAAGPLRPLLQALKALGVRP